LLEIAISAVPRQRDWMFSSVTSGSSPANIGSSAAAKPATGASIGTTS
jgi:hypothetical protein